MHILDGGRLRGFPSIVSFIFEPNAKDNKDDSVDYAGYNDCGDLASIRWRLRIHWVLETIVVSGAEVVEVGPPIQAANLSFQFH